MKVPACVSANFVTAPVSTSISSTSDTPATPFTTRRVPAVVTRERQGVA
ncbi:MAG: hypothetical protein ACOYXN_11090 [Acidobacteriota bacterium]